MQGMYATVDTDDATYAVPVCKDRHGEGESGLIERSEAQKKHLAQRELHRSGDRLED